MIRKPPPLSKLLKDDSSGVALLMALFMVLLITFIVNEVNFETAVEYTVNSQNLHRLKAYYGAKAGIELAKLRIRIYQKLVAQVGEQMGDQAQMLDQIYQMPFAWPPVSSSEMNSIDKDAINKVVKEALMEAQYNITIQTEDKLNINDLNSPSESQRKKVYTKLEDLFKRRLEQEDQWAKDNRDIKFDEIINNIKDFIDPDIESGNGGDETSKYSAVKDLDRESEMRLPPNRFFRSIEEVRMVPGVTDEVFAILEPVITIFGPFGINPNHADKDTIKSLHNTITDEVADKIMARREDPKLGGPYKDAEDFFSFATTSGAKLTEEDQTKIPLSFSNPCHFRIVADGISGKARTTITALTYDISCQIRDISSAVKKEENDEKNKTAGDPGSVVDPTKKDPAPKKPDLPKGPPRIVYWNREVNMRSVGIDIGNYSIKVLVVESTKKGVHLTEFYEKSIINNNPFDRDLEIIEFLRSQLASFDPLNTRYVLGLPQDSVSIRFKTFPFRDRIKILKSLPYELEEDLPFNTDETIFDGRITRMDSAQSEVLACASPSEVIKKYVHLMKDSNVQISLLTPDGLAFSNLFTNWVDAVPISQEAISIIENAEPVVQPPKALNIVLNIGYTKTLVLLFDQDRIMDIRSLSWGGKIVAEALSKKYEFPIWEALKQLHATAFILTSTDGATSDQIFYSTLISSTIADLLKELKFTIIEFQTQHNCTVSSIFMTGGVSKIQNLGPYLTQGLEIPVNKLMILDNYPDVHFEKSVQTDIACGTALGLALEGLRKPRNPPLNLLKGEFVLKSNGLLVFYEKWAETIKYASFLFIAFFLYASFRSSFAQSMLDRSIEVMQDQAKNIAKLKGSKANESNISKFIKERKKVIKEMKTLSGIASMNSATAIMKKINDAIPSKQILPIEISKLMIKDKKVLFEGYVAEAKDTELLLQAFKNLATNKIQSTIPVLPPKAGRRTFHFEFEVDRNTQRIKE